jgi:aspartyl-tRNA(Asn)/glutamyl-tRNA(Gln) amidotransferase subunit A
MDVFKADLRELADGYQRKRYQPSEILEQYLANATAHDGKLGAFLDLRVDDARARAKELDERQADASKLPLYGVPVAVKDNFLVRGWRTTAGSKILENYLSPYTATSVERLEAAGAILVGKTNLDEFAMGSSTENSAFGPTRNPYDPTRVPGGSSGGSAAAVAAGMAAAALGTDTGGSIRQPASLCGVVGLKPSYGRVSRYGVVAFASSLDQVGPFGRTVWDCARMLEVMAGYDGKDATSSRGVVPRYTEALGNASLRGVTVGVPRSLLAGAQPAVREAFESALSAMEKEGAKLVSVELPHVRHSLSVYYLIAPSEASSNLARYDGVHYGFRASGAKDGPSLYAQSRGTGFGREVKLRIMLGTYALSAGYYDAYYLKANQVRRLIQKDFEEAYKQCQLLCVPTSPTTAFKLGEKTDDPLTMYLSDVFTLPVNLAGLPAISVPCGLDASALPIGLQLIGRPFEEQTVLTAAYAYERLRGSFTPPKL